MAEYTEREMIKAAMIHYGFKSPDMTVTEFVEDELPAASVPQWISVEDRLPENGEYVLCWYEYFRYGDFNAMFAAYGIGYCYNGHWGGEVANGTKARVLAWMPLPDPPKGDADNG